MGHPTDIAVEFEFWATTNYCSDTFRITLPIRFVFTPPYMRGGVCNPSSPDIGY